MSVGSTTTTSASASRSAAATPRMAARVLAAVVEHGKRQLEAVGRLADDDDLPEGLA